MSTFYQNSEQLPDLLKETARDYIANGLCALPASLAVKHPTVKWKAYQHRLPTASEWESWRNYDAICIVCGVISGNLCVLDFDQGGKAFAAWVASVSAELLARCVIERSQNGGIHVIIRCEPPVGGSEKLARSANGKVLIETKAEKGLFLCAPSNGYEVTQGSYSAIPVLTAAEVDTFLSAARALDEAPPMPDRVKPQRKPQAVPAAFTGDSPAETWNEHGREAFKMCLEKHGWQYVYTSDDNEHWRRPGKEDDGTSATLHLTDPLFYIFSTNAAPFESKGYSFFQVYSILEHGGDDPAAARQLLHGGYGGNAPHTVTAGRESEPAPARKPYPLDVLHPEERKLVIEIAAAKNVAPDVVAITLDVIASTLIGASHKVTAKSGWSEPGSIWAVIIADSGDGKTRVQNELLRPLFSLQEKWVQEHSEELNAYEIANEHYKASVKKSKGKAHPAPATLPLRLQYREVVKTASGVRLESASEQAARNGMEPAGESPKPQPPKRKDLFVIDTTIEALADCLTDNPHGLGNFNDEFRAFVTSLTRYAGNGGKGGGSEAHYLSLFDGTPIKIDRVGRGGTYITNPFLSILGGIQPYVWRGLLKENSSFLHSGFTARFIFLSPPALPTVWTDTEIAETTRNFYDNYFSNYMTLREQSDPLNPKYHGLSQEAKELFKNFYNKNGEDKDALDSSPLKASYSRVCGYALRIALRRHIANSILDKTDINESITGDEMAAGIAFAEWAKNESARMLYEATGSATGVAGTTAAILPPNWADALKVIDKYGQADPRDVARSVSRFRGQGGTDRAAAVLVEMCRAGIVTAKAEGAKLVYRRA